MIWILLLVGLVAGALGAALGVGGGIIFVPALVVFVALDQHLAEGTSLAVIVPTMVVASFVHARSKRIDWRLVTYLAFGAAVGGWLGARLALGIDESTLRRSFAVLMLVVAVRVLQNNGRPMRSSGDRP